jgi:hypothetical protein
VALIGADRFTGNLLKNSYFYGDHKLSKIKLSIDTQTELRDYIKINFENGEYHEGLLSLLEGQSLYRKGRTLAIGPELYQGGCCLFNFDLTPGLSGNTNDSFNTLQRGNLRLHLEFSAQTTETLVCYFMMFFDSEIQITSDRQIMFDY